MHLVFKKDQTDYTNLIRSIDGKLLTFNEIANGRTDENKYFCIRHDVEAGICLPQTIWFAKVENRSGWKSTYFIRYFSDYFDFSINFNNFCKRLIDLGHDIGLHVDVIKHHKDTNKDLLAILKTPLDFLRSNGIEVKGVSAHGNPENYEIGFNYEFWKEFNKAKNEGTNNSFSEIGLNDLDLSYEAYFLDYDFFLADSAGEWAGWVRDSEPIPYERNMRNSPKHIGKKVINKFNEMDKGFLQLLIHPYPGQWKFTI